jgi:hypothetical protein
MAVEPTTALRRFFEDNYLTSAVNFQGYFSIFQNLVHNLLKTFPKIIQFEECWFLKARLEEFGKFELHEYTTVDKWIILEIHNCN